MPTTDELIRQLAADVKPVHPGASLRRLAIGIAAGVAVSAGVIVAWFGTPLQAVPHTGAAAFAMKLLFSVSIFVLSVALLYIAGRPGRNVGRKWLWLVVPPALIAVTATMELSMALPPDRASLWIGSTWQTCLSAVIFLSIPVFAGVLWAFQRLAPTDLRLAGLIAGVTAGSAAAVLYALYCPETTATFLFSWYSLGIAAAGIAGMVAGPKLLRW